MGGRRPSTCQGEAPRGSRPAHTLVVGAQSLEPQENKSVTQAASRGLWLWLLDNTLDFLKTHRPSESVRLLPHFAEETGSGATSQHLLPHLLHPPGLTCRLSLLQTPLTVLVGAMVTTGGVLGTLWPPGGTMMGPIGTRLGVLAGELWLVAGEDTGDDSLLSEDPAGEQAT